MFLKNGKTWRQHGDYKRSALIKGDANNSIIGTNLGFQCWGYDNLPLKKHGVLRIWLRLFFKIFFI
jgi:hypothetical protein